VVFVSATSSYRQSPCVGVGQSWLIGLSVTVVELEIVTDVVAAHLVAVLLRSSHG